MGFQAVPNLLIDSASSDNVVGLYARIRKLVHVSNVSELIPTKTTYARNLQGVVPLNVRAYARKHRVSHTTVNRWVQELEILGMIEAKKRHRKPMLIRLKPWNEIPGLQLQNAVHEFQNDAPKSSENLKEIRKNQKTPRSSAFQRTFQQESRQDSDITKDFSFLTQGDVPADVPEELKQEYKKNLEKNLANCVKGLPIGTLDAGSVADAPSLAPNGALGERKVGLSAETSREIDQAIGGHPSATNGEPCDSKNGELLEGGIFSNGFLNADDKKKFEFLNKLIKGESGLGDAQI